jgi:hypothetical protein
MKYGEKYNFIAKGIIDLQAKQDGKVSVQELAKCVEDLVKEADRRIENTRRFNELADAVGFERD